MKNIYFDICAICIFLLIIWTCYSRKLVRGRANRVFLLMNILSLVCASLDILMEVTVNPVPISETAVILGTGISFVYKLIRNASLVVYFIYIFIITRTDNKLRAIKTRVLLWLPNMVVLLLLLQNFFTHNVFSVTRQEGYTRGPLLNLIYVMALIYGVAGLIYCIYCRRHLSRNKWVALLSVYALTFVSVLIQFLVPELMVEMFATALGILMVMLLVVRPGESMDGALAIRNFTAYQTDLRNVLMSRKRAQIIVVHMMNAPELRGFLKEYRYNEYLGKVMEEIHHVFSKKRIHVDIYLERPGTIYLIPEDEDYDITDSMEAFFLQIRKQLRTYYDQGVYFDPRICLIRYPEDLTEQKDILKFGHNFFQLGQPGRSFYQASELIQTRDFEIVNHMDEILNRAINGNSLEMYFQPIYDVRTGSFRSAEALARLQDREYGMISPALFIPAAESTGLILKMGEKIVDLVYRFIARHPIDQLGLSYIEINLSVSQMLQGNLPQIIKSLQEQYQIQPSQVNFEITESVFDHISPVMDQNVKALTQMGYSFSLDDYGVGYSNIQRLSRMPLQIIKVDKSLVDDMFTDEGRVILENTVLMMQSLKKELVVEGVENAEATRILTDMDCDYIQGYYYSKPLPQQAFIEFLKDHN